MLYKKVRIVKNIPENAIGSADIVKFFVYVPSYVDCRTGVLYQNKFEK